MCIARVKEPVDKGKKNEKDTKKDKNRAAGRHTADVQQRQLRLNAAQPSTHSTHTHALARRLSHLGRAHGGLQLLRALRLSIRALRGDLLRLRQYLYFL